MRNLERAIGPVIFNRRAILVIYLLVGEVGGGNRMMSQIICSVHELKNYFRKLDNFVALLLLFGCCCWLTIHETYIFFSNFSADF